MKKAKILYGAYGAGNLGDDLILLAALRKYPDATHIACFGPPLVDTALERLHADDLDGISALLTQGSEIVFAGGGLFWSRDHIIHLYRMAVRAKLAGARVVIDSIGTQGDNLDAGLVRDLVMMANAVSVRDAMSREILLRTGVEEGRVEVVPDLVMSLAPEAAAPDNAVPVIGIAQGDPKFYFSEGWREHIMAIYLPLIEHFAGKAIFRFVPHVRHISSLKDSCLFTAEFLRILSRDRIEALPFPATAEGLFAVYRGCNLVLATDRYHALVISKLLGLPAVCLYSNPESKFLAYARDHGFPAHHLHDHSYLIAPRLIEDIERGLPRT